MIQAMTSETRKAKVTDVHRREAELLAKLWDSRSDKLSQAAFGAKFEIGGQSAVSNFLNGTSALRDRAERDFRLLFGAIIITAVGLAGMMAKALHWL